MILDTDWLSCTNIRLSLRSENISFPSKHENDTGESNDLEKEVLH